MKTGLVYTDPGPVMYGLIGFTELIFTLDVAVHSPVGMVLDTDNGESGALRDPELTYSTLTAARVRHSDSDHAEAQCRRVHKLRSPMFTL